MNLRDFPEATQINERLFRLISYLIFAAMMASAVFTVFSLIGRIVPTWQPFWMAVLGFLMALDRFYTYGAFKKIQVFTQEWFFRVGTHWVMVLVVLKVLTGVAQGLPAFLAEIPLWRRNFAAYFFNVEYLIVVVIAILIWLLCGYFAALLDEMGLDQAIIDREVAAFTRRDEHSPREKLLNLVISIGGFLVLLTAATRVDIRALFAANFTDLRANLTPLTGGGAGTLLYFMLALGLFSMTRFISLHTRWNLQRLRVSRQLAGRWALYSLIFILVVAVIASLLPTSYSLGLLSVLGYLINFVISLIIVVMQLIFAVFMFLISIPFLLMGEPPPIENDTPIRPILPEVPRELITTPSTPFPWWDLIKSILFWVFFIGLLAFSVHQYLKQHEEILAMLRKMPGGAFLARLWAFLQAFFQGAQAGVARAVQTGRERFQAFRSSRTPLSRGGFLSLRGLNPRQRVYFYYLAMLRRGSEQGLKRPQSQTPYEYANSLDDAFPDVDDEIDSLTAAFVEARYSRHSVEQEDAGRVRSYWERIRQALRRRT